MKKIGVIIPFFGKWPEWFDYFLHSCIHNPTIDWIFPNDCELPGIAADNLKFIPYQLREFNKKASEILEFDIQLEHPYKICDFKPTYGEIFNELIKGYDFWGYGDLDLIYGDIRSFYTEQLLERYDILSNHEEFITGHFCLLRNNTENSL